MSHNFDCKCEERRKKPVERAWACTQYKWNTGAFTPTGGEPSRYSRVLCMRCGASGRTKAKYVEEINHMKHADAHKKLEQYQQLTSAQQMRTE